MGTKLAVCKQKQQKQELAWALEVAFAAAGEVKVVVIVVETDKPCSLKLVADLAVEAPIAQCLSKPFTDWSKESPKACTNRDCVVRGRGAATEDLGGCVAAHEDIHRCPAKLGPNLQT